VEKWVVALDWICLLVNDRAQKLPLLLLYSDVPCCGKTTFIYLLKKLLQNDTIAIEPADFEEDFNAHWVDKRLIVMDGVVLKIDWISLLKRTLTLDDIIVNEKYQKQRKIPFIGVFVVATNEKIRIDAEDRRMWAIKVPPVKYNVSATVAEVIFRDEISIFRQLVEVYPLSTTRQSRTWFAESIIM
jgi:phage/plasmid-associated DNA primase